MSQELDFSDVSPHRREETLRRVAILRRYEELENPSPAEQEAAALEMGLSVDTFVRVLSAWKTHRRASAVSGAVGQGLRPSREKLAAAREAATGPFDLSGVLPQRRVETTRRIKAVGRYLAGGDTSLEKKRRFAADLGISVGQFNNVVRAWILHRKAAAIPGASTAPMGSIRAGTSVATYDGIMREAIQALGPDAPGPAIRDRVAAASLAAGLKPPSKSTLYNYRRAALRSADNAEELVLDHIAIELPVDAASGPLLPIASMLVQRPSGRILDWTVSLSAPTAAGTALLLRDHLVRHSAGSRVPLRMTSGLGRSWQDLSAALRAGGARSATGKPRSTQFSSLIVRALGRSLGSVRFRASAKADPRTPPSVNLSIEAPMSFSDALDIFGEAVKEHNQRTAVPGSLALTPDREHADRLASALSALSIAQ